MASVIKTRILYPRVHVPCVDRWKTSEITLTVSGGATPSVETVTIDVKSYRALALTVDHKRVGSDSTNLDATVFTSFDGVIWDTEPYGAVNLGAAKVKTIPVTAGIAYAKLKVENKDAANATKVLLTMVGIR